MIFAARNLHLFTGFSIAMLNNQMVSKNMDITGDLVSKNGETKDRSYYIWGSSANMDRFPPQKL